jgi:hypothetical protein
MDLQNTSTGIICRPFITLKNGRILWAWEKGLNAFCFPASPDYVPKKKINKKSSEDESGVK